MTKRDNAHDNRTFVPDVIRVAPYKLISVISTNALPRVPCRVICANTFDEAVAEVTKRYPDVEWKDEVYQLRKDFYFEKKNPA